MLIDYPRHGKLGIRRWLPSWRLLFGLGFFGVLTSIVGLAFLVNRTAIPTPNEIAQANASVIYYADGKNVIGTIGEFDRVQVELAQIPLTTQRAVLAAEDKDFYNHSGFSMSGIARAFMNNLSGGAQQGGSTITQQYVKNAYLTSERSVTRKLKELVLSIKLETSDSKDEILSNYLNTVYLGRGSYGLQAAARAYFGKDVDKLSVAESAMLAALLKSPEGFAPEENLERLTQRWNYVLDQMVASEWLSAAERKTAEFPEFKERTVNRLGGTRGYIIASVKSAMSELIRVKGDVRAIIVVLDVRAVVEVFHLAARCIFWHAAIFHHGHKTSSLTPPIALVIIILRVAFGVVIFICVVILIVESSVWVINHISIAVIFVTVLVGVVSAAFVWSLVGEVSVEVVLVTVLIGVDIIVNGILSPLVGCFSAVR